MEPGAAGYIFSSCAVLLGALGKQKFGFSGILWFLMEVRPSFAHPSTVTRIIYHVEFQSLSDKVFRFGWIFWITQNSNL